MTPLSVHRQQQRLDSLLALAATLTPGDPLQAHVTQLLCVRIFGFIERSVGEIYREFALVRQPEFARFASRRLDRNSNPNAENLCQLAGDFNPTWETDLRDFLADNGRKDAIDSIVANRHQIAHGEHVGVGLAQLQGWYAKVLEYLRFVERQTGT